MLKKQCLLLWGTYSMILGLSAAEPILNVTPETYPAPKVGKTKFKWEKGIFHDLWKRCLHPCKN